MNQMGMVADAERLPWLTDDKKQKPKRNWRGPLLFIGGALAALLVAGVSYWIGMQTAPSMSPSAPPPAATIELPEPMVGTPELIQAEPTVADAAPERMVVPEAAQPQRAAPVERRAPVRAKPKAAPARKAAARTVEPKKAVLKNWPVRQVDGASGRMVRIGTFATPRLAKKGWWRVTGTYPGISKIPTLVVPVQSLRNGQTYYRLQMGTTSQAHSEVLCQRMRIIGQSCVVVGLAAKTA